MRRILQTSKVYQSVKTYILDEYPLEVKRQKLIKMFPKWNGLYLQKVLTRLHKDRVIERLGDGYYRAYQWQVIKHHKKLLEASS